MTHGEFALFQQTEQLSARYINPSYAGSIASRVVNLSNGVVLLLVGGVSFVPTRCAS